MCRLIDVEKIVTGYALSLIHIYFPNFTFHLALDRPDPAADAAGVKLSLIHIYRPETS